jgi:hypothetical protein
MRHKTLHTVTCYPPFPSERRARHKIGSKRRFQIKLGSGLTSSRVATTFAVHASLIVHALTRSDFHPYGWAAEAHAKLGSNSEVVNHLALKPGPTVQPTCPEARNAHPKIHVVDECP